ncbi:MAG TPA: hypothetical protein VH351_15505 [Bryobacteraceae bacterium]|jgi:hypothetical protein|nr:hypothetical protein [Bryobacteraceae bacterium]
MTNQKGTGAVGLGKPNRDSTERLTPEQFVTEIKEALPYLTEADCTRAVEHCRAWAAVFYDGKVPAGLLSELDELEAQWLS